MFEGIDETPSNVCGVIGNRYVIMGHVDEPVEKAFMYFHIHDDYPKGEKEKPLYAMIGRHAESYGPIHMTIKVLETVKDRSAHFPEIVQRGKIEKLYFGSEGEQEEEHDPELGGRPFVIIKYDATPVSVLSFLSPQRTVPTILALMIGLGCVRALASLNRAGFVHRFVTPFNFAITNPLTKKNILEKMIITDFSAVLPWPCKPRIFVPFIGSYRYSSVRAHWGREQGPSDDIISVIYMIAEMLHGKLPWRSLNDDEDRICYIKTYFYKTNAFKKLPRQLRQIYREMLSKTGSAPVDFKSVIEQFKKAIDSRDHNNKFQIPEWLLCNESNTH
ncbi:Casein kinase I C03C10.2 in chromosome III, putative [Brugia malayi]|uniref:Bm7694 n=1 Tax=Brugia malayi TaxID=6279 RepID=A0A0J9XL16_BRUMA|nr:Casein kinase I C03C10.2 in chromosome III, putative [Brugia malayi]CDP90635.1 Bm7694 [Brugia malayi]VIO99464.1 Casein kinase I C03C10.2 in chromosome III, putative [Brugia malayi]